jgi:hypothetical protein
MKKYLLCYVQRQCLLVPLASLKDTSVDGEIALEDSVQGASCSRVEGQT